jgi:hypothetical protein
MAFMKYARAHVMYPRTTGAAWQGIRKQASSTATASKNLVAQAGEILGETFSPDRYLLTHCSIVASVDVDPVPNVKLGSEKVGSRTITRKWADYYIKPECAQFVNNNGDCWSREVLMKSYRTFIGAYNFLEHVQIEEQSKGRIIDAVIRDVGPSLYVDILVATDRKHAQLVSDIESGKLGTLSMGCFLPGTMVSLADGTRRPIEDIQPGDMVLTHKGRAREVVNQQIRRRDWSLRRIQAVGVPDEIVTTDTHPFFVYRAPTTCACGCGEPLPTPKNGRKQSKRAMSRRFKTGHDKRVFNPKNTYSLEEHRERKARLEALQEWVLEEVPAGELREGDLLCFPRAHFDHGHVPVSKERAALLGYYLAEGNLLKCKGDVCGVEFTFGLSEQDTYAAEVIAFLAREFPAASVATYTRLDRNTFTVRATDADTATWFHTHGGEYSSRKKVSPEVLLWEQDAHRALLGAWVSGDGHLDGRGVTTAVTTSYDLACQLHLLAARCGMFASLQVGVQGRSVEAKQVVNGGVVMRDEATGRYPAFTLRFGQTQAQGLVGFTDKVVPNPTNKSQANRVLDGMVTFPVTSISSEPYFGFVYDLEVEEDHSYVVEGVAVHNCSCEFTLCSQCGNVAVDETDLCEHVKYSKLNTFFDARGQRRVVAELCGHTSHGDTGGVHFIEASWVAVPAFAGAVMRNILDPGSVSPEKAKQFSEVLSAPPAEWGTNVLRAASEHRAADFDFGDTSDGADAGGEDKPAEDAKPNPFAELEDQLYNTVKSRVQERLEKELQDVKSPPLPPNQTPTAPNESVIKEARRKMAKTTYDQMVNTLVRVASSDTAFVDGLAEIDRVFGIRVAQSVYRTALIVGATNRYGSHDEYFRACHKQARRVLSPAELRVAYRIGNLLARKGGNPPLQPVRK